MRIKAPSKMSVAIVAVIAAVWAYHSNVSNPLRRERAQLSQALLDAECAVTVTMAELKVLKNRKARAAKQAASYQWANHLLESLPRPYMVEIPMKILRTLRGEGMDGVQIQLEQLLPVPTLPNHALARWQLRVAKGDSLAFGQSLAVLENEYPLGCLKSLAMRQLDFDGSSEIAFEFETIVRP